MNITGIENLSAAELSERQGELVAAAAEAEPAELAARYVKARTDAARRDEKLSEQGETIKNLNAALDQVRTVIEDADAELAKERAARDVSEARAGAELKEARAARDANEADAARDRELLIADAASDRARLTAQAAEAGETIDRLKDELAAATEAAAVASAFAAARRTALRDVVLAAQEGSVAVQRIAQQLLDD